MRILLISILFFSCVSEKKLVKFCAEKYPCDTTIVKIDTSFFLDTQYIKTETIDTFIVTQNKTIVEVKYVESTAKIQLAKESHILFFDLGQHRWRRSVQDDHSARTRDNVNEAMDAGTADVKRWGCRDAATRANGSP